MQLSLLIYQCGKNAKDLRSHGFVGISTSSAFCTLIGYVAHAETFTRLAACAA